jgi:hypothetical protein
VLKGKLDLDDGEKDFLFDPPPAAARDGVEFSLWTDAASCQQIKTVFAFSAA